MKSRDPFDYSENVRRGAQFLDAHVPGWDAKVVDSRLDLGDGESCVLGQLFAGHYAEGKRVLRLALPWNERRFLTANAIARQYGFAIPFWHEMSAQGYAYSRLTEQWLAFLHARRSLAGLAVLGTAPALPLPLRDRSKVLA